MNVGAVWILDFWIRNAQPVKKKNYAHIFKSEKKFSLKDFCSETFQIGDIQPVYPRHLPFIKRGTDVVFSVAWHPHTPGAPVICPSAALRCKEEVYEKKKVKEGM